MILNNNEVITRLNSPLNLINKLKSTNKNSSMSLFGVGVVKENQNNKIVIKEETKILNPFQEKKEIISVIPSEESHPDLNNLLENADQQIKLTTAHNNALEVLTNAVEMMKSKLDDVRADKLPAVISATSKVVESIRRERSEQAKNGGSKEVHYHFYTPVQKKIEQYEVIEVS